MSGNEVDAGGLDRLIVRLARTLGITFVMVTHELASILGTNDRVIMLNKESRSIIAEGTPEQLATSQIPAVQRFFRREQDPAAEAAHRETEQQIDTGS